MMTQSHKQYKSILINMIVYWAIFCCTFARNKRLGFIHFCYALILMLLNTVLWWSSSRFVILLWLAASQNILKMETLMYNVYLYSITIAVEFSGWLGVPHFAREIGDENESSDNDVGRRNIVWSQKETNNTGYSKGQGMLHV